MKTNVNVERKANGLYRVTYRGKTISDDLRDEQTAQLNAHHYRHAPSLLKTLGLKKLKCTNTAYAGRPFWGVQAGVSKGAGGWEAWARIEDADTEREDRNERFPTRQAALEWIAAIGREKTTTRNILNPEAGDIEISRGSKGGCCDPGTERYHSM